jgi:hypothetical protein
MNTREHFLSVVDLICKRPGMFTGTESLKDVSIYLNGLEHGLTVATASKLFTHAWHRWLEGQYLEGMQGQPWTEFLIEKFGSDGPVLEALPSLYRQFFEDLDVLGETGIHERASQRLIAKNTPRNSDVRYS